MTENKFRISFDLICLDFMKQANWRDTACAAAMYQKLVATDRASLKSIDRLFKDFVDSGDVFDSRFPDIIAKRDTIEMKRSLTCDAFCSAGHFYYINPLGFGVNLFRSDIEIRKDDEYFLVLFAYRFSKTSFRDEFLDYHLKVSYDNDWRKYKLKLTEIIEKYSNDNEKNYIITYIENPPVISVNKIQRKKSKGINEITTLKQIFGDKTEDFDKIIYSLTLNENGVPLKRRHNILQTVVSILKEKRPDEFDIASYDLGHIFFERFGKKLKLNKGTISTYFRPNKLPEFEPSGNIYDKLGPLLK